MGPFWCARRSWESVSYLFENDRNALLLTTPALQPAPGRCRLPTILLLEAEPDASRKGSATGSWRPT
jgi:diguanylate cyclase